MLQQALSKRHSASSTSCSMVRGMLQVAQAQQLRCVGNAWHSAHLQSASHLMFGVRKG